jgi:hypothetical protein
LDNVVRGRVRIHLRSLWELAAWRLRGLVLVGPWPYLDEMVSGGDPFGEELGRLGWFQQLPLLDGYASGVLPSPEFGARELRVRRLGC